MDLSSETIAQVVTALPQTVSLVIAIAVIACKVVTVFVQPPAETSKWAPVYRIVNTIGLNIGWAANRLQIGKTGVMVSRSDVAEAKDAITQAGIPLATSKSTTKQ